MQDAPNFKTSESSLVPSKIDLTELLGQSIGPDLEGFSNFKALERVERHLLDVGSCRASSLGYQCSRQACPNIRFHWSLGGPPPSSVSRLNSAVCTYASVSNLTSAGALDSSATEGFSPSAVSPDSSVPLTNTAGAQTKQQLTICYTRQVASVGQSGITVTLGGATPMNFAASEDSGAVRHMMDRGHLCSNHISLLAYTTSNEDDDEEEGGVIWTAPKTQSYVNCHGGLMMTAWVALAPLGIVVARHKWVLSARGTLWLQLHRGIQGAASLLALIGFIIPFSTFGSGFDLDDSDTPTMLHSTLGTVTMLLLSIHITLAFFRPAPDAPSRYMWNVLHYWNGRVLNVLSILNVCIGILLYRIHFDVVGTRWIVPLVLLLTGYGLLDLKLTLDRSREVKYSLGATEEQQPRKVEFVWMGYMPYRDSTSGG